MTAVIKLLLYQLKEVTDKPRKAHNWILYVLFRIVASEDITTHSVAKFFPISYLIRSHWNQFDIKVNKTWGGDMSNQVLVLNPHACFSLLYGFFRIALLLKRS